MSKKKLMISMNKTIGIRKFMEEYLGVEYTKDHKLSHYLMEKYLLEKGMSLPVRANINNVTESSINCGEYLIVREETKRKKQGKMLIYKNPQKFCTKNLLMDLKQDFSHKKTEHIRNRTLINEHNLFADGTGALCPIRDYDEDMVLPVEYDEEVYEINSSVNRQKVYTLKSKRHLVGRRRYK